MSCNLSAQFTTNRSATTCYQNDFTFNIIIDRFHIYLDWISAQQIFHVYITELADIHLSIYQLIDSRQGTQLAVSLLADLDQFTHSCTISRWNRNNNLINTIKSSTFYNFVSATYNFNSLYELPPLVRVIINNTFHGHGTVRTVYQLLDHCIAGFSGANDHDLGCILLILGFVFDTSYKTIRKSSKRCDCSQYQCIHKEITTWNRKSQKLHSTIV